jgi:nucleotide-binding universal stress UspA family protein
MFQKILCPVDFSPGSRQALRVAVQLAEDARAELRLAHVWHLPSIAFPAEHPYPASAISQMVAASRQELASSVAEAEKLGARKVSSVLLEGLPWQSLCDTLKADPEVDLVVMGTHGRTGFRRVLLGSVAEKIVRLAPCSVLVVRGRAAAPPHRHVLCPVDFSDGSKHAVELAAALAARDGVKVTLVHVLQLPTVHTPELSLPSYLEDIEGAVARNLDEWAGIVRAKAKVPVETRTLYGSPGAEILTALDADPSVDLVVVGSHRRRGLERLLLGSVAEQVVRHAPCPVLVARKRAAGEAAP